MISVGPFFYIDNTLLSHKCSLTDAEKRADKIDNPYGHDQLYDDYFPEGDYIDYPRGRVVCDCSNNRGIIYIDPCINKLEIITEIAQEFGLTEYTVDGDLHYHCKNCLGNIWNE